MAIPQDQLRGIDQVRQRLSQLCSSVSSLRADLERGQPLPTWPALQAAAQALAFNLQQLQETTNTHAALLRQAHAYPLTNFPGHAHEALLAQLLRKRLDPGAEKWVEEHTTAGHASHANGVGGAEEGGGMSKEDFRDLWNWAGPTSQSIVGPMLEEDGAFADDYTIAEREAGVDGVVTGLRRKLDDEESEDEDDDEEMDEEDEKMEDVMPGSAAARKEAEEEGVDPSLPPVPLESILRFTATGTLPPELQRRAR